MKPLPRAVLAEGAVLLGKAERTPFHVIADRSDHAG